MSRNLTKLLFINPNMAHNGRRRIAIRLVSSTLPVRNRQTWLSSLSASASNQRRNYSGMVNPLGNMLSSNLCESWSYFRQSKHSMNDNVRPLSICAFRCFSSKPTFNDDDSNFGHGTKPDPYPSILSKQSATAPVNYLPPDTALYRRILSTLPPAVLIHLSIGSVYVYSMWTPSLTRTLGVVAAAPADWTHSELLPVFSCAAVVLGVTTHVLGEWVERVGPRVAGTVGSACWGGGLLVGGAGVSLHGGMDAVTGVGGIDTLPMLYLGYGLLGGIGWGLMYLTPVTSIMKWFPDRRGLATGMALSAFGAGAALGPGWIHALVDYFSVAPEFVGECLLGGAGDAMQTALNAGDGVSDASVAKQFVELTTLPDGSQAISQSSPVGEPGSAVVVATEADLAKLSSKLVDSHLDLSPGVGAVYKIGTGDTGVAKAMGTLGVIYGAMGMVGSRFMSIPHAEWSPNAKDENGTEGGSRDGTEKIDKNSNDIISQTTNIINVGLPASYVTKHTNQYPLLWLTVFGNATGGMALLSSSKLMLTDIFTGIAPTIVTPTFATGYVSALGVGMALGRFGWSAMSDALGRKETYKLFGLGMPIVGMAPFLCHKVVEIGSGAGGEADVWPYLATFYGGSVLAITFYGGVFSILPAYIADLFGQKHAGAIHGKALTAWAASAVAGPMGLAYLRSHSQYNAMQDLLQTVDTHDPTALDRTFGCSLKDTATIDKLVEAKTLTIEKLMELAPEGTVDPTPFLYDTTCYVAAGLMSMAFLSNLAIRPLDLPKALKEVEVMEKKKI